MNVTDPIADLSCRISNASGAGLKYVSIPASTLKIEIVKTLEKCRFIRGYRLVRDSGQGKIKVALSYGSKGASVINGIKRVSRPGLRVYAAVDEIPTVLGGMGVSIMSTCKGVMIGTDAKQLGVGGEVLLSVW
jgi:small subunit ribosomal protein S8